MKHQAGTAAARVPIALGACAAALAAVIAHAAGLRNGFIGLDDPFYITHNPLLTLPFGEFLRRSFTSFDQSIWAPLLWVSLKLDHAVWGLRPFGYHLTNIALHAANTALVVLIVARLCRAAGRLPGEALGIATATGVLFGVHPLQVEAVAWATARKDVLHAFWYLAATYAAIASIRAAGARRAAASAAALGAFALAIMAKPVAVTLPAALLLLDAYPFRRLSGGRAALRALAEKAPFLLVAAAASIPAMRAAGGALLPADQLAWYPLPARAAIAAQAVARYLANLVAPWDLSPYYPVTGKVAWSGAAVLGPAALLAAVLLALAWGARRAPWLAAGGAFFLLTLSPTLGIVSLFGVTSIANRFAYVAAIGPFLIAACAFHAAASRLQGPRRGAWLLAGIAVAAGLGLLSARYTAVWRDPAAFWDHVAARNPSDAYSAANAAAAHLAAGNAARAVEEYGRAITLNSFRAESYHGRGEAFLALERPEKALEDASRAITLGRYSSGILSAEHQRETMAPFLVLRARALERLGRDAEMIEDLTQALAFGGDDAGLLLALGRALRRERRDAEALEVLLRALSLDPASAEVAAELAALRAGRSRP